MTRLLLVGCSACKDVRPEPLPARERYTGVFFRVIAKAQRAHYWPADLELVIVSARYGLLLAESPVPWYEQKLSRVRAREICWAVSVSLDSLLLQKSCSSVCVAMGQLYRQTVTHSAELQRMDQQGAVYWVDGEGTGVMQGRLRDWLRLTTHWLEGEADACS